MVNIWGNKYVEVTISPFAILRTCTNKLMYKINAKKGLNQTLPKGEYWLEK